MIGKVGMALLENMKASQTRHEEVGASGFLDTPNRKMNTKEQIALV